MTAKIIRLSEYLEQYRHSIVKSVAHALGMNPENRQDLEKVDEMMVVAAENKFGSMVELETNLIAALEDHDDEAVKNLLNVKEFNEETFNGVDIAEGFNFRCHVKNEVARGNIMDWLEEGGLNYLIDNEGHFAVKCPNRKVEYKVTRAFEHMTNKWDRGPIGKAVDPDLTKQSLADIKHFGLNDGVNEIAASQPTVSPGTGKGVETGLGPSMFPADKKKKTTYFDDEELDDMVKEGPQQYPDNEDGARQLMADEFANLSDNTEIIPDPSVANVWLAIDHDQKMAWIVYLADSDAEDVDYEEAVSKYSKRNLETGREYWESAGHLTESKGKKKKRKTAKQREKAAKEKLASMGPAAAGTAEKIMKDFGLTGTDTERMEREKRHKKKKEMRKKVGVDEETLKLDENVMGMIGMPNIGRMKELAGLPNDTAITVTTELTQQETPSCEEYSGLDLAMSKLEEVFKVYSALSCEEKQEFRKNLIDCLMKDG